MAAPRRERRPVNQFRRDAKFEETALLRLAYCFCQGISVAVGARMADLSPKSTRALYLEFRQRLTRPKFNPWHAAYQRLPWASSLDQEMLVRSAFFDVLADCYANVTCHRNFTLGNRKARLCRSCPLPRCYPDAEHVDEALAVVDAIHAFYAALGIKGETARDPVLLFRLRLIHTTTIATARTVSGPFRAMTAGRPMNPNNASFLSIWRLLDVLLGDLAEQPL